MSIRPLLPILTDILDHLGLADAEGLQLVDAAAVAARHHPPLNPDYPALLVEPDVADLPAIARTLLNQYPPEHAAQLVAAPAPGADGWDIRRVALEELSTVDEPLHLLALAMPPLPFPGSMERFQETIAHLRAPEGCPWDRKQTHQSLRPYLLEETYEVLDALDSGDPVALREELGDLLLQIVLHSQIAVDAGEFRMPDVIASINEKIIRRHPHVWGDVEVSDDQDVKVNWDRLKEAEKREERTSRLEGVSKSLPALSQSFSYQDRAARVGFDWTTIDPVIAKVHEELQELLAAQTDTERAHEMGDLLFAAVNLARWLNVDPESALRDANQRFFRRFRYIEEHAAAQNRPLEDMTLTEMDALWDDAKANGL